MRGLGVLLFWAVQVIVVHSQATVEGAIIEWNGSASTSWNDAANWSTGVIPTINDDVYLNAVGTIGYPLMTLGADQAANSLTFQPNATTPMTLSGDTLTLGSGGMTVNSGPFGHVISSAIVLGDSQTWTNNVHSTPYNNTLFTVSNSLNLKTYTLTVAGTGNKTLSGVVSGNGGLTKEGSGTLTLNGGNTYIGTVTLRGGVLSTNNLANYGTASGIGQQSSALGAAGLVLDGGTLRYNGSGATADRLFTLTEKGGTLEAGQTNNVATSALSLNGTGPIAYTGTGNRTLTLAGNSGGNIYNRLSAKIDDASVSGTSYAVSVVKRGDSVWTLTGNNTYSGGSAIHRGYLIADNSESPTANTAVLQQNPLGTGRVTLYGGELRLRANGDGTGTVQNLAWGTDVTVSAPATLRTDRVSGSAQSKNFRIRSLTVGSTQAFFTSNNSSRWQIGDAVASSNTAVTLTGNAYIPVDVDVAILGKITESGGHGGLMKGNGALISVMGSGSDYTGGTTINSGSVLLGRLNGAAGSDATTNASATLGSGPITVNPGGNLHVYRVGTNLGANQTVDVYSSRSGIGAMQIEENVIPTALRAYGSGALALATTYSTNLDLARLGDGTWSLGYWSTPTKAANGTYSGTSLGVGAGNVYRLGAFGQLNISSTNVLTGSASVEIGRQLFAGGAPANGTGVATYTAAQNYTGSTTVNRGSAFGINGRLDTSRIDVFGNVVVQGGNGTLIRSNGTAIPVNIYGGYVQLDNNTSNPNRWDDSTPVTLYAGGFVMTGSKTTGFQEDVGAIDFYGGSYVQVSRSSGSVALSAGDLTRQGRATLYINHDNGQLGTSDFFRVANGANYTGEAGVASGDWTGYIAKPFIYSYGDYKFVKYDTTTGSFKSVGWTSGAKLTDNLDNNDLVEVAVSGSPLPTVTVDNNRGLEGFITNTTLNGSGTITVKSGGLIVRLNDLAIKPTLKFGADGTTEGIIWFRDDKVVDIGTYSTNSLSTDGQLVTSGGLTKAGTAGSRLRINSAQPGLTGGVVVTGGYLDLCNGSGTDTSILGTNDITLAGYDTRLYLRANTANTFSNVVKVAENVPMAQIHTTNAGGSATNRTMTIKGLTLEGAPGAQGQTIYFNNANQYDLAVDGPVSVKGNVTFHVYSSDSHDVVFKQTITGVQTADVPTPVISKTGDGLLRWESGANTFAKGTTFQLQNGSWELRGPTTGTNATPLGNDANTLVLERGTLYLKTNDLTQTFGPGSGYDLVVRGDSSINVNRYSTAPSAVYDRVLSLGTLSIGNQWLSTSQGYSYRLKINGTTQLTGRSGISASAPTFLAGTVSGGALQVAGSAPLFLDSSTGNTYEGGTTALGGGTVVATTSGSLGTGPVTVRAGGGVALRVNGALRAGQTLTVTDSSSASLPTVGLGWNVDPTTISGLQVSSHATTGVLALTNGSTGAYNQSLNLSNLYGGRWYLGATGWIDGGYKANALGAGADNLYRLGGGGGTLVLNRNGATTGSGTTSNHANADNLLTGTNDVVIGVAAGNASVQGTGRVAIAGVNDFTGTTTIHRGSTAVLYSPVYSPDGGATYYSGLSNTTIDVYGTLYLNSNGTLKATADKNANPIHLHPGSQLYLNSYDSWYGFSGVNHPDRLADNEALTLDGARLTLLGADNKTTTETVGDITFLRGASIQPDRQNSTGKAQLTLKSLTRGATGATLMVWPGDNLLGASERLIVTAAPTVTNGMVAPYIVNGNTRKFLTYDTTSDADGVIGFKDAGFTSTNINTAGPNDIVDVLDGSGTITLSVNPTVYALRVQQNIAPSSDGKSSTITVRSGGVIAWGTGDRTVSANLRFAEGETLKEGLFFTHGRNLYMRGAIDASSITKSGDDYLIMQADQPHYSGGWTINNGLVRADTLGAYGTSDASNTIVLNGGNIAGGGAGAAAGLYLYAATDSPDPATYSMGKIIVYDAGRIYARFGDLDDRTQVIGAMEVNATGSTAPAFVSLENTRNRSVLQTGMVSLNADTIFRVNNDGNAGRMSRFEFAGLAAMDKTMTKLERGVLALPDISSTFTGGQIIVAGGPLRVTHNGSLGSASTKATIEATGVLEIATSNFTPIASLTQNVGSFERWLVEDARGSGDYIVPTGVTLQLGTSVLPTSQRTITLSSGAGLEGFLYNDEIASTANRILGTNVAVVLAGDVTVGQNSMNLANLAAQGRTPDAPDTVNPNYGALRGAPLWIQGSIRGTGNLTKVGRDVVTLSGDNSFAGNVQVDEGILRIGRNSALPSSTVLTTRYQGLFDLYGYDQQLAALGVREGQSLYGTPIGDSGRITNSAYEFHTLTVGSADNYTYNGQIIGNVSLTKTGAGVQTLAGVNTYFGVTTVAGGTLRVTGSLANNGADHVFVGLDEDGDFATSGPMLTRALSLNASCAGWGSSSTGGHRSQAGLLAGTNTSGIDREVSMAWRAALADEPLPTGMSILASDVLHLTGMINDPSADPHQTDLFVLQMSYDETMVSGRESDLLAEGGIRLAWLGTNGWEDAVEGNIGGTPDYVRRGYQEADASYLGRWGVDIANNVVWAVLNHNSDFAVLVSSASIVTVPEPTALVLLFLGGLPLTVWHRRRGPSYTKKLFQEPF